MKLLSNALTTTETKKYRTARKDQNCGCFLAFEQQKTSTLLYSAYFI